MSSDENDNASKGSGLYDEIVEPPAFGPAALGLHRVGTKLPPKPVPTQPIQVLNARGMPARIRKKNKLFYDDDIVNDTKPLRGSPKRPTRSSPIKTPSKVLKKRRGIVSKYMRQKEEAKDNGNDAFPTSPSTSSQALTQLSVAEKKIGQNLGMRLRNLLKLPKAHKWVSYEWFYSYIDRPLFSGENDFQVCLKDSFPSLKTRKLTRIEWSKIRRMMGKPRRCSQAFFMEERRELDRKRQKIRLLQARKTGDISFVRDLPKDIPLPLSLGTKVTARLREPHDGIFTGNIVAIDSMANSYRVLFDRSGLGTHTIQDIDIFVGESIDTVPLSSLTQDVRPKLLTNEYVLSPYRSDQMSLNKTDPMLAGDILGSKLKSLSLPRQAIGGFPLKLLELVVRTRKTLSSKKLKLMRLRNMNADAEMYKSLGESMPEDYQRRYANMVISMEKLNRDMQEYLNQIQSYTRDLTKDPEVAAMLAPSYLREKCRELGNESVQRNNLGTICDPNMLRLITDLSMIMWVASNLSNDEQNSQVVKVLEGCLEETKSRLDPKNIDTFQKCVQIHTMCSYH